MEGNHTETRPPVKRVMALKLLVTIMSKRPDIFTGMDETVSPEGATLYEAQLNAKGEYHHNLVM